MPVYSALDASTPFIQASNGFAGAASDGLTQLDTSHALTNVYTQATNGNLVQTALVDTTHSGAFALALGFGTTRVGAVKATEA